MNRVRTWSGVHAACKLIAVRFDRTAAELAADNAFTEQFMAALFLPHTDMAQFPSVEKVLEGQGVK